jgi:D-xylonolactonase
LDLSSEEGRPDGITVDAEGCLWVAMSGGWCVVRYDDRGGERERITFPARKITSICFGDEALDTLYVTSSSRESVPDEEIGLEGGALFALRPGVTGLLDHRSNVNI